MLKLGSRGEDVKKLQEILGLSVDGVFGPLTETAVIKFQKDNNLTPDGIVGDTTWKYLNNIDDKKIEAVILKEGSQGEDVKKLQKELNITIDGDFGAKTKLAVIDFQTKNGLSPDGIVGAKTWEKLGFTIVKKHGGAFYKTPDGIIINESYLSEKEYLMGSKPRYIFLHHTAGWYNPYANVHDWNTDKRGAIATEFLIGGQDIRAKEFKYDGEIVKCIPDGGYGWHLGIGNNHMHRNSTGIELNNFGQLDFRDGKYYAYPNNFGKTGTPIIADESQVVKLKEPFRGYQYFHKYSDKQIESLKELIYFIGNRNNIDITEGLPKLIKEKGVKAFDYIPELKSGKIQTGIWAHVNVIASGKWDIFPQEEIMEMLINL